ncbi:MAG: hypothetical protein HY301_02375 [Verrucomicrobia bacterium]|nr:hypothetical protein [Verrucomicrobiota bacterium]
MKHLQLIALLVVAYFAVWLEATFNWPRRWLATQVDVLPALVVYAALFAEMPTITAVAVLGGLWFDALSANPLGVSVLPLFAVGFVVNHFRELIMREQAYAQYLLGLGAGAAVPLGTLLVLLSTGASPLIGWGSLWQWLVMTLACGALTPAFVKFFNWLDHTFGYRELAAPSFREDREIVRNRR